MKMWPFNKIKSSEFRDLEKKISELEDKIKEYRRKVEALDVDISVFWSKLDKAIKGKHIRKEEDQQDQQTEDLNSNVLLPEPYGFNYSGKANKK